MAWTTTRSVTWIKPPDDGAQELEEYRLTLSSCSVADSGNYYAYLREFYRWYEETYGMSHDLAMESQDRDRKEEALRLYNQANDYAAVMASARKFEHRSRSIALPDDASAPIAEAKNEAWTEEKIPEEWKSFSTYRMSAPWSAALSWTEAAHAVNPGLWRFQTIEDAKKNGGVSVS
jgi:hypothetical protein